MSKRRSKYSAPAKSGSKRSRLPVVVSLVAVLALAGLAVTLLRESPEKQNGSLPATNGSGVDDAVPARKADYEIVASFAHDPAAYTQGLLWNNGSFYESTGLYGHSELRRVEFPTGKVLKSVTVAPDIFAEGLALADGRLIQLTWKSGRGFVYDLESFKLLREFTYETEGWGITYDGQNLIMSDGSSTLTYLDANNFRPIRRLNVTMNGAPLQNLNELEFINGEIWSNVWLTDLIVRIDPASGRVTSYLEMKGLFPADQRHDTDDVLNGIAYDPDAKRIFVGGKRWPRLFEVRLK